MKIAKRIISWPQTDSIEDTSYNENREDFSSGDIELNDSESHTKLQTKMLTLVGVARIAREDGKTLDKKQYTMYEVLACTVLLYLINKQYVGGKPALARKWVVC